MRLGWEIVRIYHGEAEANHAKEEFIKMFQKKVAPNEMPEISLIELGYDALSSVELVSLMVTAKFAPSKGEARRLIEQGGVKINEDKISDPAAVFKFTEGDILRVG